ncbi:MAG: Uma2 family endonuclease [Chloroflexi bacterium]|nr:Uma2 family endonuclease [Chloroflexota bacterium]
MAASRTLLTADDFYREYSGKEGKYELVDGEVITMAPPGYEHGEIALAIGSLLRAYARQRRLGRVSVESGFVLDPGTVRAPDVAFVKQERIPQEGLPKAFFEGPPDLAVEVVSPSDTAAEVEIKVHDCLESGATQVWLVYPDSRRVYIYQYKASPERMQVRGMWYSAEDTLPGGDVLPGFSVLVADLFAP